MLTIQIIVTFACIFIAGMHYAVWDQLDEHNSIYYCIGLGLIGLYNLISIVGYVTRNLC
jgi:hypothetical protein